MKRGPKRHGLWRELTVIWVARCDATATMNTASYIKAASVCAGEEEEEEEEEAAALLFGALLPLHGPLVHGGGDPRVIDVQQPEARHVDPAVATNPNPNPTTSSCTRPVADWVHEHQEAGLDVRHLQSVADGLDRADRGAVRRPEHGDHAQSQLVTHWGEGHRSQVGCCKLFKQKLFIPFTER
ncbi:hypothetical protein EYF80_030694 [Liparis tanakae]|uniref:Uncharacterized protein n=1 Tax=Liparis tanakae TaxID=230148 RepID=A0A4Z2H0R8_9TELE|nr:hypothetical protein EYF80_030694 [Liparis tanakae]